MEAKRWQIIEDLLDKALETPPEARPAFLNNIPVPKLRQEVESLLEQNRYADAFLAAPALEFSENFFASVANDLPAGQKVGNYEIVRELARGGMGAVYEGRRTDGKFEQTVAVKLLRRELNTEEIRRRFDHERQILASLSHPNIARLLDAGTTSDGVPFLVMEFVDGTPITDYCDREDLSLDARLHLFRKVCEVVMFAHRNLVVHRDLKPSNILVTADGTPKLLDFGISKLLTADADSQSGASTVTKLGAMTPDYASPEQVRGDSVTTSTDVYSLGVILYELLTGNRPFEHVRKSPQEIIEAVCNTEPRPPSAVISGLGLAQSDTEQSGRRTNLRTADTNRGPRVRSPKSLKGDLDNIVLKALKKEPNRRYSSVEQFSEDIRRHLADIPVIARPDTVSYRARKFVSRNRLAVTAAFLVLASLVGGIIATLYQVRRAERRFAEVRELSNALLNDIAPKIERLEGSTEARTVLVAQSLKYLDSLAVESNDDAALQGELAAAYEKVGILQGDSRKPSLSDFRGSISSLEKAQVIRRRLLEANQTDTEARRLLATNLRLLSVRRVYVNDTDGGFADGKEAISIYEGLVAERPESLELQKALLDARVDDGVSYAEINRFAEAIPLLQSAEKTAEELHRRNESDADTARTLANCLLYLGNSLSWENRQPEAEAAMARAVEITESLAARFPNDTNYKQDLWRIYQAAAGIYEELDDAKAFELCDRAREVAEAMIASDASNAQARHNLAKTLSRLGSSASNLGRPIEAINYLEQAAAILLELQSKDPLSRAYDRDLGTMHKRIGDAKYEKRDFAGSLAAYKSARTASEKDMANNPSNTRSARDFALVCRDLGWVHSDFIKTTTGDTRLAHLESAKENYRQAVDVWTRLDTQNALSEVDRKNLQEARLVIDKLEKMN